MGAIAFDGSDAVRCAPAGIALITWPAALASRGIPAGDQYTLACTLDCRLSDAMWFLMYLRLHFIA